MTDHFGYSVPEDEPLDKEILVWEIDPHLQNSDYDYMVERSYQEMLSVVQNNLEHFLERHTLEDLTEGVTIKFRLTKMTKEHYEELIS